MDLPKNVKNITIGTIFGVIGSVAAAWQGWEFLVNKINTHIEDRVLAQIEDYNKNKTGSLSNKLAKELGVEREIVHRVIGDKIKALDKSLGKIKVFEENYLPMLEIEAQTILVGITVVDEHLIYTHTDGKPYTPIWWAEKRAYYFKKSNGEWEMCH